jgi:TIR domain
LLLRPVPPQSRCDVNMARAIGEVAMNGHHFISYSTIDAPDFAIKLCEALLADGIPVWLDKRDLCSGEDWDSQVAEAIRDCETLLFVMTPDSVQDNCTCKQEWTRALKYKKPIVPPRVPPRLSRRACSTRLGSQFLSVSRQPGTRIGVAARTPLVNPHTGNCRVIDRSLLDDAGTVELQTASIVV